MLAIYDTMVTSLHTCMCLNIEEVPLLVHCFVLGVLNKLQVTGGAHNGNTEQS